MKLLNFDELRSEKGISYSKSHLFRLIRTKKFPRPVRIGENRIGFVESEIDDFIKLKIKERDSSNSEAA